MEQPDEPDLPAAISSITQQKRRKDRFSIFVNDTFLIGVSEENLLAFNLSKGVEITPALYQRLQRAEGRGAVKNYFMDLLSRRDHARRELADKAQKKDNLNPAFIDDVLDELEEKEFIDDRSFAIRFASEKATSSRWGPAKITSHLWRKGIGRSDIDYSIEQAFEKVDLKETLTGLVLKRKRHFQREEDRLKRKKKIFDYLARRGFHSSSIHSCLDELTEAVAK